jgi:hypothetical protein
VNDSMKFGTRITEIGVVVAKIWQKEVTGTYFKFLESGKGYIWKYFQKLGVFLKICGPQLDFAERHGAICKCSRNFLVSDLFFNGKSRRTRSTTHGLLEALVHGGPWPWLIKELTEARPSGCSGAQ